MTSHISRFAISLCALGTLLFASSAQSAPLALDGIDLAAPLLATTPKTAVLMAAGVLGIGFVGRREERLRKPRIHSNFRHGALRRNVRVRGA